ncbi:tRNA lysidine(34) synthetase TilS [bacterium]|nr:tRNA lysidine(34) synthetase TilS [bacterium]
MKGPQQGVETWKSVLTPESLVVAGISGGPDSVYLLLNLMEAAAEQGWQVHAVHVHHHQRGAEADADAEFVRLLAGELGVPCAVLDIHPDQISGVESEGDSLEGRLREARLSLLRAQAAALGADAIALGHHAGDLAESFLLMALRGSGPTGLGSLREARFLEDDGIWLIRPLLSLSRADIEAELRERGQDWREDSSNRDPKFRRNRLRMEVMPLLQDIESGATEVLARSACLCAEESELLDETVAERLAAAVRSRLEGSILLDAACLRRLKPAMASLVIRRAWARLDGRNSDKEDIFSTNRPGIVLPPPHALTKDLVRRLRLSEGEAAHFGPVRGFAAMVSNHEVLLYRESDPPAELLAAHYREMQRMILLPDPPPPIAVLNSSQRATVGHYEVPLPAEAGRLEIDILPALEFTVDWSAPEFTEQRTAVFDTRSLKKDLILRSIDPKEPLSISGGQKKDAGDVLQEGRIPADMRRRVAGLADDRGVLWIPGVRRAAASVVTDRTELIVRVRWISKEEVSEENP